MGAELHQLISSGRIELPVLGGVRSGADDLPWIVTDGAGAEIEAVSAFLKELALTDASSLTCRSYAHDLLRWWRLLALVDVAWDRARRVEVELLVGWMRTARNPQRDRAADSATIAGSVNSRTGKPYLRRGYAPATINHALTVISGFYTFHAHFGRGPLENPVPPNAHRRLVLAHRSPIDGAAEFRRAPLRQKTPDRRPRAIPDPLWEELFAAMASHRDRALLAFYVSSGARASELLGVQGGQVDWAGQRIWVITKGSRLLEAVPGSPEAFSYLARYFDEAGTPGDTDPVWRTRRGESRPLTYSAMRRVLQRANDRLGTNWTLHDLRHTASSRMANDPTMTLPEVQTVLRHRTLAATQVYVHPDVEQLHDKLQEHFVRPRPQRRFSPGYDAADFRTVFGG